MANKGKHTKEYKSKFKFDENNLNYEVRLRKKNRKWWLLLFLLLLPLFLVKCNKNINLQVVDDETNIPIADATVYCQYEYDGKIVEDTIYSDENGIAIVRDISQDVVLSVETSKSGYISDRREAELTAFLDNDSLRIIRLKHGVVYRNVDIVMCIDGTGSMNRVLNVVKKRALSFHSDLQDKLTSTNKKFKNVRIKVIVFRDYADNWGTAMEETAFYNIPGQEIDYKNYVSKVVAKDGGDEPENGLEALTFAIRSNWFESTDDACGQIIIIWTDASAHTLGKKTSLKYPSDMPKSLDDLKILWNSKMNSSSKRLLIFSPNVKPWNTISNSWEKAFHFPFNSGSGVDEAVYESVITSIVDLM